MASQPERDDVTGQETTGHEWDGIKELNTPLPRWWLWTFYLTVVWAVAYWIAMPAWPLVSGYTKGILGYSQRAVVADRIEEAAAEQSDLRARIADSTLEDVRADQQLFDFARGGGRSAFAVNCSQCHGLGAAGSRGFPNLNDDAWIWGGTLDDIYMTLRVGIRADHDETRENQMPAFLRDQILTRAEVEAVADYVLSLTGKAANGDGAAEGATIFAEQCAACHGEKAEGMAELGAPSLADRIWLYGGEREDVIASIANGRGGIMPAWEGRLDDTTLKQLAIYVHSLGGGQ